MTGRTAPCACSPLARADARALSSTPPYLQPFDQCRLSTSLTRLRRDHGALRTALADSYERIAGRDVAAPIEALRLYELQWRLTRGEADDARPDERVLLAEYRPVDLAR